MSGRFNDFMFGFLRFEQPLLARVPWSMATSSALALIRPRELFTINFLLQALQIIIPKIGHCVEALECN